MPPLFDSFIVLIIVLLIARFVKRGSPRLQRLFIPSALIAGIAGLALGPQLLGAIPAEVTDQWARLPRHLINIIFAGLFLGKIIPSRKEVWRQSGPMIALGSTLAFGQYVLGLGLVLFFLGPVFGTPSLAGGLIEISFAGGHGTAAGLAPVFEELGWSEGTDIALGLATLSIITAVFSGIFMINFYKRKHGHLHGESWDQQQQRMIRAGYNLVRLSEKINTNPKAIAINALAFATSIGIGWAILRSLVWAEELILSGVTEARFFAYVPLFPLAMVGGLIVQLALRKLNRQHLIQRRTAEIFSAIALDLLIASAIATISLSVIGDNLPVFITLGLAGIVWITVGMLLLAPRFFADHWFERGVTDFGQAMGMTATGLLMNRLADPSNRLRIKESFAYKQLIFEPFLGGGLITATSIIIIHEAGPVPAFVGALLATIIWLLIGLHLGRQQRKPLMRLKHFFLRHY